MWWTDDLPLWHQPTFVRLALAMLLGALIGAERQWRQRSAGLRTNALVCFGASAFVDLGDTIGEAAETARVISYVVSGVGFLGAGAIIKDGAGIRGLNTAATLWCSAAVGACAGAGQLLDAIYATTFLVAINLVFRPLARAIDRRASKRPEATAVYSIGLVCRADAVDRLRELLLAELARSPAVLRELRSEETGEEDVRLSGEVEARLEDADRLHRIAEKLGGAPGVSRYDVAMRPGGQE